MGRKTRPGRIYRQIKGKAYTRKEYMGGVPHSRITEFDIGDPKGDYNCTVHLIPNEQCKITHTSLEAARIAATRFMSKTAGNRF
ncbi:MAG: ribosomal protein L16, partial [Thermoplasmata archaeon]|nr:ribosomal protein L16 [Thermoplasmata archaeon]